MSLERPQRRLQQEINIVIALSVSLAIDALQAMPGYVQAVSCTAWNGMPLDFYHTFQEKAIRYARPHVSGFVATFFRV
jgi:hypothetical protein